MMKNFRELSLRVLVIPNVSLEGRRGWLASLPPQRNQSSFGFWS